MFGRERWGGRETSAWRPERWRGRSSPPSCGLECCRCCCPPISTELRPTCCSKAAGPLPEARVREILLTLTEGLPAVHAAGLLHRDIKPDNVMLRPDGMPVLVDFGAARQAIGRHSRSVTAVPTPGYAPIEQYSARGDQGPWTDIYALGAVAFWALSGETPVEATERVVGRRAGVGDAGGHKRRVGGGGRRGPGGGQAPPPAEPGGVAGASGKTWGPTARIRSVGARVGAGADYFAAPVASGADCFAVAVVAGGGFEARVAAGGGFEARVVAGGRSVAGGRARGVAADPSLPRKKAVAIRIATARPALGRDSCLPRCGLALACSAFQSGWPQTSFEYRQE